MSEKGTVKSFSSQRGFGFIQPNDGSDDIFCHFSNIGGEGFKILHAGQKVEYSVEPDDDGRNQAINVTTDLSELITEF